jgi:hypothetical protein
MLRVRAIALPPSSGSDLVSLRQCGRIEPERLHCTLIHKSRLIYRNGSLHFFIKGIEPLLHESCIGVCILKNAIDTKKERRDFAALLTVEALQPSS